MSTLGRSYNQGSPAQGASSKQASPHAPPGLQGAVAIIGKAQARRQDTPETDLPVPQHVAAYQAIADVKQQGRSGAYEAQALVRRQPKT